MPQKRSWSGTVRCLTKKRNTDRKTRTGVNAHHQDFRGAIRERHQVSAADPSDLNGSSSNVLAFDSKKNLESELVERFQARRCVAILVSDNKWSDLSKWNQDHWREFLSQFKFKLFRMTSCHVHCSCVRTLGYAHRVPLLKSRCSAI